MILVIGHFGNTKFEALRNARVGYGDSRSVMHMFVKFYKLNNYIVNTTLYQLFLHFLRFLLFKKLQCRRLDFEK